MNVRLLLLTFQLYVVFGLSCCSSIVDGVVGDVLFWSLRRCLGADYDYPSHLAWVRIFCSMLKIIVPLAIQWEMKNGDAQIDRLRLRSADDVSGSESGNSSAVA